MGYLRVALALAVVVGHFGPHGLQILPGQAAVQGFFLISGFYMFLILENKYSDTSTFYLNRFLRLYPSYAFVLVMAILMGITIGATAHYLTLQDMADRYSKMNFASAAFLIFANASMLFQDVIMFLKIDGSSSLAFTPAFYNEAAPAFKMLVIPQAWSISLEIIFYALAPFVVRLRSWWIALIVVASFALRCFVYSKGMPYFSDPWGDRFFPFEIALFLAGGLMYRASRKLPAIAANPVASKILTLLLLAYCLFYAVLPSAGYSIFVYKYDLFLILIAASLPFLHSGQKFIGVNKFLAELSYPVYINHLLILNIIGALSPAISPWMLLLSGMAGSLLLAVFMVRFIEEPIDALRQRIATRQVDRPIGPRTRLSAKPSHIAGVVHNSGN